MGRSEEWKVFLGQLEEFPLETWGCWRRAGQLKNRAMRLGMRKVMEKVQERVWVLVGKQEKQRRWEEKRRKSEEMKEMIENWKN